jgi:hypothetical protein
MNFSMNLDETLHNIPKYVYDFFSLVDPLQRKVFSTLNANNGHSIHNSVTFSSVGIYTEQDRFVGKRHETVLSHGRCLFVRYLVIRGASQFRFVVAVTPGIQRNLYLYF